jgi:DNA (cytosine-5)-methyltransferase 1
MKKTSNARGILEPISTLTSVPYHGLITHESWRSFLTYYYGKSQASAMNEPAGTIRANDGIALVSHDTPRIEDCYFRMLRPDEIKLAMAFDRDYIILGSQKDQVKQCGNAVTPPVMEWLVERAVESLQ